MCIRDRFTAGGLSRIFRAVGSASGAGFTSLGGLYLTYWRRSNHGFDARGALARFDTGECHPTIRRRARLNANGRLPGSTCLGNLVAQSGFYLGAVKHPNLWTVTGPMARLRLFAHQKLGNVQHY